MTDQSFATSFTVDQTPQQVFAAITNVRGWWTSDIDGSTEAAGDEFTYRAQDRHSTRFRVTEAVAGRTMSWLVLENYFDTVEDTTEWAGTTVRFDIAERDGKTEVRFAHQGLVPAYECFGSCSNAWGFFVNTSLYKLITTGTGMPNSRDYLRPLATTTG